MTESEVKSQLGRIQADLNRFIDNSKPQIEGLKSFRNEVLSAVGTLQQRIEDIDRRAGTTGGFTRHGFDPAAEIASKILESRADFEKHGRLKIEVKSTLLSTGLVNPQTSPEIGTYGGWAYGNVRALFRSVPADAGSVYQLRETGVDGWNASPQSEGNAKNESVASLTAETLAVQTIAHYVNLSKQAWVDVPGRQNFIETRLLWGLAAEVDQELVSGSGVGVNMKGMTTFAQAFNAALLGTSYDYAGIIGAAAAQVRMAGFEPNFALMNPADAYRMRFRKATDGQYVGTPDGLPPVVETMALNVGSFIVGDSRWAVLRPRMMATIDLSESHASHFTSNLLCIRAEERLAFQPLSHRAFVTGSLDSSPA